MKKIIITITTLFILSLFLTACSGSSEQTNSKSGDSITLKLAHSGSDTHQYKIASKKFA